MTSSGLRRVERHLGTAVTLGGRGIDGELADRFFDRIAELEAILSRFRPDSELSQVADGRLRCDRADRAIREVLGRCASMRQLTDGAFEHEPRRRGDTGAPALDPNAFAKGWIIEEAAMCLRVGGVSEFFVNAGGDVLLDRPHPSSPFRVGIQHPDDPGAVVAVLELSAGAVATSGTYERGNHIRSSAAGSAALSSVTVAGPDLAEADALATAVFATGREKPRWWHRVDSAYGLLTLTTRGQLRWTPPGGDDPQRARLRQPQPVRPTTVGRKGTVRTSRGG